jgi:hypothetical protein
MLAGGGLVQKRCAIANHYYSSLKKKITPNSKQKIIYLFISKPQFNEKSSKFIGNTRKYLLKIENTFPSWLQGHREDSL